MVYRNRLAIVPNTLKEGHKIFEGSINERIWHVVASIPKGRVCSYSEVARRAGLPGAARRVGSALKALPPDSKLAWHRVVSASGRISLPPGASGADRQRSLLEGEGVAFKLNGSIDMKRFGWQ